METIAPTLAFAVKYKKKDISSLLAPYVTSITFNDNMDNTADTISIELEDSDDHWMGKWYPTKTDEISLSFGYLGETALNAGTFYIDQISLQAPPSTVTIEGIGKKFSGRWRVTKVRHSITASGYLCTLELTKGDINTANKGGKKQSGGQGKAAPPGQNAEVGKKNYVEVDVKK